MVTKAIKSLFSNISIIAISMWFILTIPACLTFAETESDGKDFFEMSIEELMEVDVVISGSRREQAVHESPVPISVVTCDDIHYSGLTSIPEVLQFATGVDVLRLDRNRYAVGVRGLHDFVSDRTLTLINGRIADNPVFGGSEFYRLPILMEDILRIEVVRGPGGAAWGANAFTGVINIITKKPEDVLGVFGSTTINEYGDTYTHVRMAERQGRWDWRFSAGYEDMKSSVDAGAGKYYSFKSATTNNLIGFSGYKARDFSRDWRFDSEAIYHYSDDTVLSMGAGYSHDDFGGYEFGGYHPYSDVAMDTVRPYVRIDHSFDDGSEGYLQWFSNIAQTWIPSLTEWRSIENDFEGQLQFNPVEDHKVTLGGNYRFTRIDTVSHSDQDIIFNEQPYNEQMGGVFAMDSWSVSDRLTLESQIRGDWYSETQYDWSMRTSALYALDWQKNHVLRFSFAKSFRTPMSSLRQVTSTRIPIGGGAYAFNIVKSGDLKNEETWALEGGYVGKLNESLTAKLNAYYQRFDKMLGFQTIASGGIENHQVIVYDGADSYGVELELEKATKYGKLGAWYAFNDIYRDMGKQDLRSYGPAKHKVGLTSRLYVDGGWVFNTNYRFSDRTLFYVDVEPVSSSHRLDFSLSKSIAGNNGEVMIGVSDVLNGVDGPNYGLGQITAFETPGRTFFARLQIKF